MKLWTLAAVIVSLSSQAAPPRSEPPDRPAAAGAVRGRVIAAATRAPLHRVRITLTGPSPNPLVAVTDTKGEYELTAVPPGAYTLSAARAGYLTTEYGQRRPREAGRRVTVRAGETTPSIDLALARAGVLAGTVSDDAGEPYAGVRVDALEFRYVRGRRVLVTAAFANTNDQGRFRLGQLQPGTYLLRGSSTDTWEEDDGRSRYTYAMTYFPGVTGTDQAQSVALEIAQELSALDFSLRRGRAAQITGRVETATGDGLPAQAINLSTIIRGAGNALFASGPGANTRSDANGSFAFNLLAPGEYMASSGGQSDRVSESVIVADGDTRHVVLTPKRPAALAGTIVTDEGKPPPPALRVEAVAADADTLFPSWDAPSPVQVGRDGAFRFASVDGQYLLRVAGLRDEWMLASISHDGRDVTDAPLAVKPGGADVSGVRMVISRKGGIVEGQVTSVSGQPTADATVLVFAVDRARWTVASRFVRTSRPDDEGRFIVAGLPPGVYHAIARDFVEEGRWEDPEFLASLTRLSSRVEVAEGETHSIALRLEPPQ